MSDDERRIEGYEGIVGSGMLTDPERIQKLEAEKARRERAWRKAPEKGFDDVLGETPPKEHERVGVYVAAPLKGKEGEHEDDDAAPEGEEGAEGAAQEAADAEEAGDGPRVPPDPRMAALHQQFDRAKTTK